DAVLAAAGADQLRPAGVGVGDLELGVRVVAVGFLRRFLALRLHGDGAGLVHAEAPLGDVVVVGAPVGHLAPGGFIPPAELVVAAREVLVALLQLDVIDHGRLAEPEVPLQFLGRIDLGDDRRGRVAADAGLDRLDLADAAVAHQLAGHAEAGIAAL